MQFGPDKIDLIIYSYDCRFSTDNYENEQLPSDLNLPIFAGINNKNSLTSNLKCTLAN